MVTTKRSSLAFQMGFLLGLVLLLGACTDPIEQQEKALQDLLTQQHFSGVLLWQNGEASILLDQLGWADAQGRLPFKATTPSNLGPLSEAYTAATVQLLINDGKVALQDPLQKHIPSFPYAEITIEQLLKHQSGLPDFLPYTLQYWDTLKNYSAAMLLDMLETMEPPLDVPPGTETAENPVDYIMLAGLIDIYSNTFINEYLPYKLFQPLHMGNSYVYHQLIWDRPPQAARAYSDRNQTEIWEKNWTDGLYGHANYYSSVADWNKFIEALEQEKGLLAGQLSTILNGSSANPAFNHGFWSNGNAYWRFGQHHGYMAGTYRDPSQNLTLIWLANNNFSEPTEFMGQVLEILGISL